MKRQGAAARQLAVSFYNWKRAVKDTLDAMEALRAQKKAPPQLQREIANVRAV